MDAVLVDIEFRGEGAALKSLWRDLRLWSRRAVRNDALIEALRRAPRDAGRRHLHILHPHAEQWAARLSELAKRHGVQTEAHRVRPSRRIGEPAERSPAKQHLAYHGTAHTVDRFRLSAIGTGEGVQTYGWGLYFADKREVAVHYRNMLSNEIFTVADGTRFNPNRLEHLNVRAVARLGVIAWAMQTARRVLAEGHSPVSDLAKRDLATLEDIQSRGGLVDNMGNLYQVEIPDDADLLEWEKPLGEHPPRVQERVHMLHKLLAARLYKPFFANPAEKYAYEQASRPLTEDLSGETVYHRFVVWARSPQEASRLLNRVAIPGLRYRDAYSRNMTWELHHPRGGIVELPDEAQAREYLRRNPEYRLKRLPTYNYVIWDERRIRILAVNDPAAERATAAPAPHRVQRPRP